MIFKIKQLSLVDAITLDQFLSSKEGFSIALFFGGGWIEKGLSSPGSESTDLVLNPHLRREKLATSRGLAFHLKNL